MEHKAMEFKLEEQSETTGVFSGYASVYNGRDQGGDRMLPGAFTKSIEAAKARGKMPKMLFQHDPSQPIGVWDTIESDNIGLKMSGRLLLDIPLSKNISVLMKAGAIDGLSIGYKTIDYSIESVDGQKTRLLKEVELWETSVVTFPMDLSAVVTDVKQLQSAQEVEKLLRKAGVPGGFAKLIALHGYEGAIQRVNGDQDDGPDEAAISALLVKLKSLKETFNA